MPIFIFIIISNKKLQENIFRKRIRRKNLRMGVKGTPETKLHTMRAFRSLINDNHPQPIVT